MAMFYIFLFFLLFMIAAAIIAVHTDNLLSSVICVGAIGFGGALMFLFLRAPDIAITQVVVEVLGLIILIRVCIARDITFVMGEREFFGIVVSVAILLAISLVGVKALDDLPDFGTPAFVAAGQIEEMIASQEYIEQSLSKTGAANAVAAIILDWRAYDTLGEATVLFTSIVGAVVILRKKTRNGPEIEA
jgi:multisubunit Na+/H+ antiporter MnhB subunit